jgi:hypothetical protein
MDKQQVWYIIKKVDIPEEDWWLVDIVKFLKLTSMKAFLR